MMRLFAMTTSTAAMLAVAATPAIEAMPPVEASSEQVAPGVTYATGTFLPTTTTDPALPSQYHLLRVAADFAGHLTPAMAGGVTAGNATVADIAADNGAIAAVNGGFFIVEESWGLPGQLGGLSIVDGVVRSEAVDGRTTFLMTGYAVTDVLIDQVTDRHLLRSSTGAEVELDGIDRPHGLIRNCGGLNDLLDGQPFSAPLHDRTCTDDDELVLQTSRLGIPLPDVDAAVRMNAMGTVLGPATPGETVGPGERVVTATGTTAAWLREHARIGATLTVTSALTGSDGPLSGIVSAINGGPRLVTDGMVATNVADEGMSHPDNPSFEVTWANAPNPRTAAGITAGGDLLLVVVDGRQPQSPGLSIDALAELLVALGAVEAVNLDGGGSSTMVIGSDVVNSPSDAGGPRVVGDALLLLPAWRS